jgi:hypothetical protein
MAISILFTGTAPTLRTRVDLSEKILGMVLSLITHPKVCLKPNNRFDEPNQNMVHEIYNRLFMPLPNFFPRSISTNGPT